MVCSSRVSAVSENYGVLPTHSIASWVLLLNEGSWLESLLKLRSKLLLLLNLRSLWRAYLTYEAMVGWDSSHITGFGQIVRRVATIRPVVQLASLLLTSSINQAKVFTTVSFSVGRYLTGSFMILEFIHQGIKVF